MLYKYLIKSDIESQWENIEFIRKTQNHTVTWDEVFQTRKKSSLDQEEWYNKYSQDMDISVWVAYQQPDLTPIGYVELKIESIQDQRLGIDMMVNYEFLELGYEELIIQWAISKGVKKIEVPIHKVVSYVFTHSKVLEKYMQCKFQLSACLIDHIQKNQQWRDVNLLHYIFDS